MQLTAGQAATQIITIYRQAIKKTIELVKDQPDGDTIKEEFEELLNDWQTNLLTIGQHIMVMTESEKNQIERAINMEHMNMQYDDHAKQQFTDYSLGIFPYHSTHPNLYQKLKSINIITQFAFFDLLKKQNKDAMEKWGEWMVPYVCE